MNQTECTGAVTGHPKPTMKVSWFSVNWNFVWFELVRVGRLPVGKIAASCREGLSLWCQSG